MIRATALALMLWPASIAAQVLSFPGNAVMTTEQDAGLTSLDLATGPWANGSLPVTRIEGILTRQVWRTDATGITTLQLLRPLRDQLRNAGYDILFDCQTEACGGFDFRFAMSLGSKQYSIGDSQAGHGSTRYAFDLSLHRIELGQVV